MINQEDILLEVVQEICPNAEYEIINMPDMVVKIYYLGRKHFSHESFQLSFTNNTIRAYKYAKLGMTSQQFNLTDPNSIEKIRNYLYD